jgi:hypothetical protein
MSFIQSALSNPVTFSHAVPSTFNLPRKPENGPDWRATSLNADGFGSIAIKSRGTNHYGSGVNVSNGSIKAHLYVSREEWDESQSVVDGLTFVFTREVAQHPENTTCYRIMGISMLNQTMKENKMMRVVYGSQTNSRQIQRDVNFFGVQIGEVAGASYDDLEATVQCFNVAQRTKIPNIFAALKHGSETRSVVGQWDRLYLVIRRYAYEAPLTMEFGEERFPVPSAKRIRMDDKDEKEDDSHYWQFEPFVSRDGKPPPEESYSSLGILLPNPKKLEYKVKPWIGGHIYIGKNWGVYGEQKISSEVRNAARNCLHPSGTQSRDQYKRDMIVLPHIEFFMRTW